MPIKNLTDRATLKPRLPVIGKLRKGGEKTAGGYGPDLDHFRFTADNPDVVTAFRELYGASPRVVNVVMYYETYEECFSTWIERWDASGLVFRSDGENWIIWREGETYRRGTKAHKDHSDQNIVGRLSVVIPEMWYAGHRGTITLETHSNHDLRNIGAVLLAAEQSATTLRGMAFTLRRVQEQISVPGWGDRKGQRSKVKKWLVKLEPPRDILALMSTPELKQNMLPVDNGSESHFDAKADPQMIQGLVEEAQATPVTDATSVSPQSVPADLHEKWGPFCMLAKTELGYKHVQHVTNTLRKVFNDDEYQPFHTGGPDAGKLVDSPAVVWAKLVEHQAAKSQ